jgi:hypothetical protein
LPFGLTKNAAGQAVPEPATYPGLLLAFRLAAEGKSDREVADALNAAGHRTTGNRGRNPFTKDTVRPMMRNRFYLGQLPDGRGGWLEGRHDAVLDEDLYDAVEKARSGNRKGGAKVRSAARRYSFTGLAICGTCGGPMHVQRTRTGRRASSATAAGRCLWGAASGRGSWRR